LHLEPYVTVAELARYWLVSRKLIYKQIEAGTLRAIRLGPRLLRIRTPVAIEFERSAHMNSAPEQKPGRRSEEPVSARHASRRR
jgi:excisionase family DNA binding protein